MAITVFRKRGQSTARYDLYNATVKPECNVRETLDRMDYCDEIEPEHVFKANMFVLRRRSPFYRSIDGIRDAVYTWCDKVQKDYNSKLYNVVTLADRKVLPLISQQKVRRREKPTTPFFSQLKKDLTVIGKILRKNSDLGQRLLDFTRSYHKIARKLSLGRRVDEGFIFGFAHTKFCEELNVSKSALNRLLNLAAGLGLITKITPVEARGIGEFWHKRWNVGMLQFRLEPLNLAEIERRWNLWINSGVKLHDVTLTKIRNILGVDVETHPEVKDKSLRQVIKEANASALVEAEQKEAEILATARDVLEDPFDIGHTCYNVDIKNRYTADDARKIIADIIDNHNETCRWQWYPNDQNPLLKEDTIVSYSVIMGGRKVVYNSKRFSELPTGLLVEEWQFKTARKFAKEIMNDLYRQGLLGIIQHVRNGNETVDKTYGFFLQHVNEVRENINYHPADPKQDDITVDIKEDDLDETIKNLVIDHYDEDDIIFLGEQNFVISRQRSTSL